MRNGYLQGKSYLRQSVANMSRERFARNHPMSYGWQYIDVYQQYQLPVYQKDDAFLMRHPAQDCWLLFWMNCWQPIDLHISELSESLETIKLSIELEIAKEEFGATVLTMAA